ncbi:MAG: UbiA family prenyltransferase [Candidatus Schekmanbacteria bacterium]|nr:UbiA family prenyltransferase [Candidatus Schekmanbacteria bacterium]
MNSYLKLFKVRISLLVTLTSAAAFVIASKGVSISLLTSSAGVFLLAAGASALNQVQENKIDAMMERTMARPIPSGEINVSTALSVSIAVMVAGLLFLLSVGLPPAAFGIMAVVWYNGFYTPLKKKSAFAAVRSYSAINRMGFSRRFNSRSKDCCYKFFCFSLAGSPFLDSHINILE